MVASAYHGETGRFMEVYTNEPGMQFYSGNFWMALCLQRWRDLWSTFWILFGNTTFSK